MIRAACEPHKGRHRRSRAWRSAYSDRTRVADAAIQSYPEWVIKVSRQQAEPIMDKGKAQYYSAVAKWLARVCTACQNIGQQQRWQLYPADLLSRHKRKYKLMLLLDALR